MNVVARLPWWIGVALAVVAYVWLHNIAGREVVMNTTPGQIHTSVLPTMLKAMAGIGQYLLPFLCLLGAGISAFRRSQRKNLITNAGNSNAAAALDGVSWQEFELLVGESFRLQGYQVTETGGGGADGGIDLVLRKGGEKFFVQCKQWKAFTVGVTVVRELYGVMAAKGSAGGFVVTSGRFTQEATDFAKGRNVQLIDGPVLMGMIRSATVTRGKVVKAGPRQAPPAPAKAPIAAIAPPACPVCSKAMVQRMAKKGANAGQAFWGCSGYPGCKGTRPVV
jgi:restriction system protein